MLVVCFATLYVVFCLVKHRISHTFSSNQQSKYFDNKYQNLNVFLEHCIGLQKLINFPNNWLDKMLALCDIFLLLSNSYV
jgi:hypothetical protein